MKDFKVKVSTTNDATQIQLSGALTEWTELPSQEDIPTGKLIIDFQGLEYINSIGIGVWVKWIEGIVEAIPPEEVEFENCTKAVVLHFSNVLGFLPKGSKVKSLDVPFYCEACDEALTTKYILGQDFMTKPPSLKHQEVMCPSCKEPTILDAVESTYFSFLQL